MKAEIVSLAELKKTAAELEAERVLADLLQEKNAGKAIKVTLTKPETPRKINRIFRKAAAVVGKEITTRTKGDTVIIKLKPLSVP